MLNNFIAGTVQGDPREDMRERFISARPSYLTNDGGFQTELQAAPNEEYRVRLVVDNSGDPSNPTTTARDSRLRVALPPCPTTTVRIVAVATSSSAVPKTVWATTTFTSSRPFRLVPSGRPAKVCVKFRCEGNSDFADFSGENDLYTEQGALVGTQPTAFDGVLPGLTGVDILAYVRAVF